MSEYSTTVGLDLGDKFHYFCVLDAEGEVVQKGRISSTGRALRTMFARRERSLVVIEAGTHSPWVSRALEEWGHEVLVANPRKLRAISADVAKCDERDAEMLARLGRADRKLLRPIRHRGAQAQADRAVLKSRDALVKSRTSLINHCRGLVKSLGERLPACSSDSFPDRVKNAVPEALRPALGPILQSIADLTARIHAMDQKIEALGEEYADSWPLRTVRGVGPLTSLAFVVTLEDPHRFPKSRSVAVFLGLVPRRDDSGEVKKQLRITKAGDALVRRLLISCAHYMLGPFGEDSDLRRWGLALCERGGKNGKKRAVVAVARKLAVILHRLWRDQRAYEPLRAESTSRRSKRKAAA